MPQNTQIISCHTIKSACMSQALTRARGLAPSLSRTNIVQGTANPEAERMFPRRGDLEGEKACLKE